MSIKRLPPEAIETFTLVLHPKRRYKARKPLYELPSVASISPDLGDIYAGAPLTLSVTGVVDSVSIGGSACSSVVQSGTTVTCLAPAKSAGTYDVTISGPGGSASLLSAYEAWHPTVDYPNARTYQSDQLVTSASSATRNAMGVICEDDGIEALDPSVLAPFDGQGFVELPSGRLIRAGGAPSGHADPGVYPGALTNAIWSSDDRGATWSLLLAKGAASSTRPEVAHTFGFFTFTYNSVLYVYWLGGDPFIPTGDVFRIPASALDANGNPNTAWERVSTTCPTSGLALYLYGTLGTTIYVGAGQVDINNGAANKNWWKSEDGGATWTNMGAIVPATVWGDQVGFLPEKDGKLWIAGSGRYDSVVNDFSNAVHSFNGTSFTEVLANGHVQFPKSRYHSCVTFNDRLWRFNGTTWDGVTLTADTTSAYYSSDGITWTAWAQPFPWGNTHAQAAIGTDDGIYLTEGFQSNRVFVIREYTGALVSQWEDLGGAGLDLSQATNAKKPLLALAEQGLQPGITFTRSQFLGLASPDRSLVNGHYEAFFVGKTLNFDQSTNQGMNAPATVVGANNGSSWNNFGFYGDSLIYKAFEGGWQPAPEATPDGANLNDDNVRLYGVRHENNSAKLYVGLTQQGTTVSIAFDTSWTGWDGLGAGYNTVDEDDYAHVVLGAVVVLCENAASNVTFLTKLNKWAKKWGSIS